MAEGKIQHCSSMAPNWDPEAGLDPGDSAPVEILESRGCSPLLSALLRLWLETSDLFLMCGMLSHFSHVQLFVTSWTVACQAPLPMRFFRQEYWSGLPYPPPGDFPNPGIESRSPTLQADSLPSEPPGKPTYSAYCRLEAEIHLRMDA